MTQPAEPRDRRVLRARALREERRVQILAAGHRVFAQKGYHSASIHDIIGAAGIARGTFYLYFESKRAIFEEILDDLLLQLRGCVRGVALGGDVSPQEQLRANLERVLGVLVANRDTTAILLRQAVGLDEDFDRKLAEFYGQIVEILTVALTIGMEIGLVRPLEAGTVARCILGSLKEVVGAALLTEGPEGADLARLTQQVLDYNLSGVLRG